MSTKRHCDRCDAVIDERTHGIGAPLISAGYSSATFPARIIVEVDAGNNNWTKRDLCAACIARVADALDPSPREAR